MHTRMGLLEPFFMHTRAGLAMQAGLARPDPAWPGLAQAGPAALARVGLEQGSGYQARVRPRLNLARSSLTTPSSVWAGPIVLPHLLHHNPRPCDFTFGGEGDISDYPWIARRLPLELRMVPNKASWLYVRWLQRRSERSHKHRYELRRGPRL